MTATEPVPTRARSRRVVRRLTRSLWLRLAVSAVLLGILVAKIHPDEIVPEHRTAGTFAFLAAGLWLMAASFVVAAWRWQRVLAVLGAHVPLHTLSKHYLAGQFVGNVLPSTVGGDVLRVSRSAQDVGARDVAFAAVVLERLTGFIALPLLSLAGFLAAPDLLDHGRSSVALVIAGVVILFLVVVLFLAGHPRAAGRFADHANWMRYIGAVHVGVDRLRRDPRDALGAIGAAIAYQATVVASVYCAVHTLNLRVPNAAVLAFVPAVAMAQVVPITIGGLGVREGMLAFFFHPLGVPTGQSVAVGLMWYGMTLLVSFVGAPAFAVGHKHQGAGTRSDREPAAQVKARPEIA